jgi:HAMP domain-containing protein
MISHRIPSRPLLIALSLACAAASAFAQDTVPVPKRRLDELERKAAEVERLTRELEKARAELEALRRAPPPASAPHASSATTSAVAGQTPPEPTPLPPTPAIATLPPLAAGDTVQAIDLIRHFAADPAAAQSRYTGKQFRIEGEVGDLNKSAFLAPYQIIFKVPGQNLRAVCQVTPPAEYPRVYVTEDRRRVVGELRGARPTTFVESGKPVRLRIECKGLRDDVIRLTAQEQPHSR